jgi:hypothetical protein
LILLGGLLLLEKVGVLRGASSLFWGVVMLLAAGSFLVVFAREPRMRWWAVIPGLALAGMGVSEFLPASLEVLSDSIFLGAIGLAFILVYLTDTNRWWGIIPGGVLATLAIVANFEQREIGNTASLFFVGLGLTFLLVAILPHGKAGSMQWAYIPAIVLVVMGAMLGSQVTAGMADYVWPGALILVGLVILVGFFMKKE